jgi:hypothetical protein
VLLRYEVLAKSKDAGARVFCREEKGRYAAQFVRGAHFDRRHPSPHRVLAVDDSPLCDPLHAIGFDRAATARILVRFPVQQIQLWADVTLAAIERKGPSFFRRSPQAFFMDNIQNAVHGQRTPPDWFWDLRKQEQQRRADRAREVRRKTRAAIGKGPPSKSPSLSHALHPGQTLEELTSELFACFLAAGQGESEAMRNARRFAQHAGQTRTCPDTE